MSHEFANKPPTQPNRLRGCLTAVALFALLATGWLVPRWLIPPDEQTTLIGARTAIDRSQPASARALLQRLLYFQPKHPEALYLLGDCWTTEGRFANALDAWLSLPEDSTWAIKAQPHLGLALMNEGRLEEAERIFLAYLRRDPDAQQARDQLHWLLFNRFRPRELEQFLESQLDRFPDRHSVLMYALHSELRPPQPREGIAFLEQTNNRRPGQATVLMRLGNCYWQTGRIDEAQNHLQEALAIAPTNRDCLLTAANFCIDQRAFGEAHKLLAMLSAKDADYDRTLFLKSLINESERKFKEALEQLNDAMQQRPDDVAYLQLSGSLRQRLGRNDEALENFREANRLETIQSKLVELIFQGVLEYPTPENCKTAAGLLESRGRLAQARGWRALAMKLSERSQGRHKP